MHWTGSYTDSLHPIVDKIAISFGYKQLQYAVVIDAGSTGSRVIGYEFHIGYLDNRLVLDKELFVQVKPGLSSYHDKPAEVIKITVIITSSCHDLSNKTILIACFFFFNRRALKQFVHY